MGIIVTNLERIMDAEQQVNIANARADKAEKLANILLQVTAEQGIVPEEIAAEYPEAFKEVDPEEVLTDGALRKQIVVDEQGMEKAVLVKYAEPVGRGKVTWTAVEAKKEIIKDIGIVKER